MLEDNLYSLKDLKAVWEDGGWRGLAEFAEECGFQRKLEETYSSEPLSVECCVRDTSSELFSRIQQESDGPQILFHMDTLLALSVMGHEEHDASSFEDAFWRCRGSKSHGELSTVSKVARALIESHTMEDAIISLAGKQNCEALGQIDKFFKQWRHTTIRPRWKRAYEWVCQALTETVSEEESWWNCAWLVTEEDLLQLSAIEDNIVLDVPLSDEEHSKLNQYIEYGHPVISSVVNSDESETYSIYLDVDEFYVNMQDLNRVATLLLVQPAFQLAQKLTAMCSRPRFKKQCRAPSCGKWFWTGRANATNCPGSNGNKKNDCSLEWIRYGRYLTKLGKDPERDWDSEELRRSFRKG